MAWFRNKYHCEKCDASWEDEHSCGCDDECPSCGRDISPEESEDLTVVVSPAVVFAGTSDFDAYQTEETARERAARNPHSDQSFAWVVQVSPKTAEYDPDYEPHRFDDEASARAFADTQPDGDEQLSAA